MTVSLFIVLVLWLLVLVALPAAVDCTRQMKSLQALAFGQDDYHFMTYQYFLFVFKTLSC